MKLGRSISNLNCKGAVRVIACCGAILAVSACGQNTENRIAFDGVYFRAKASKVDDDRSIFTASVKKASLSPEGAREAAAYEALRYCIENYGTSRILWTVGPDNEPANLISADDVLTLQGECNP